MSEADEFNKVYSEIVDVICNSISSDLPVVRNYFKEVNDHNVPHGKRNRGLMVKTAYKELVPVEKQTKENLKLADVAGWCIEWMQASFLIHDDIMDESTTRRGAPCWYIEAKKKGLGLIAINDGIHLMAALYIILHHYFKDKPYYMNLVTLYQQTVHQTCNGQCLDMLTSPKDINLKIYTMERYKAIVKWKTAYYSFYLPISAAMVLAGITDPHAFKVAEDILLDMGEFFQIQDDYLDCYGDPAVTGKVGTDIEEGKCSWLVVQALQRITPAQRIILEKHYGRPEAESAQEVKKLYKELNLLQCYRDFEEESFSRVTKSIDAISSDLLPKEMFHAFASRIYKRKK